MALRSQPALPISGTYPIQLAPSLREILAGGERKRKRGQLQGDEAVVAFKYSFKPASISPSTPGSLVTTESRSKQVVFDVPSGGRQVFEVKEEQSKGRECVLLWDEEAHAFTLHALPTTYQLTLNRSLSARHPAKPNSVSSASSSSSTPLALRKASVHVGSGTGGLHPEIKPRRAKAEDHPPGPQPAPRATKGGKSLPPKSFPAQQASPKKTKPSAKGGKAKSSKRAVPKGKFKSAEMIEDSDEEAGAEDGDDDLDEGAAAGGDLDDEFARMVGESLAGASQDGAGDGDEDEDDDVEEEDEDDVLGGATLVGGSSAMDDDSEWL